MNRFTIFLLVAILLSWACVRNKSKNKDTQQDIFAGKSNSAVKEARILQLYEMPAELKEISGISFIDSITIAAVEDENGIIYFYNLKDKKITGTKTFAKDGDYEDLTVVGNDIYVVKSNGKLYQVKDFRKLNSEITEVKTPFKDENNIEGLTYDKAGNRLLIAPKDKGLVAGKKELKDVYEISLPQHQVNTTPIHTIDLDKIAAFFKGDGLEEASKKFLKALGNENMNKIFRTSALAVHPETQQLFILSSINNIIAVMKPDGAINQIIKLSGKEFSQPEGIAFTSDGRLFISNEGNKHPANIIEIAYE